MRDKAARRTAAIEAASKVKVKKPTKAQQAKIDTAQAEAAQAKLDAEDYHEVSGGRKRQEARVSRKTRASQDRKAGRLAFRGRWRDRYNAGTVAAMRAIYEGRAPKATEAMRRSVAKSIASIRRDDPDLAERLFGKAQPTEASP